MQEYFTKSEIHLLYVQLHINKRSDLCFPTVNFQSPVCVNYVFFSLILPSVKQGYMYTLTEYLVP